jgi:hypothetical protein
MDESTLKQYARTAVEELKAAGEWVAHEDTVSYFADYEPKDAARGSSVRVIIVLILRGESPEGIYVNFELKRQSTRAHVEEVKRQIRAYFQDDDHRYEWPVAFTIHEIRQNFQRTYEDWSPEEEVCYAAQVAKGKERAQLAEIFERVPGAAITPMRGVETVTNIAADCAANLLGAELRCGSCGHSTVLHYGILQMVAKKNTISILSLSKDSLLATVSRLVCKLCHAREAKIKM